MQMEGEKSRYWPQKLFQHISAINIGIAIGHKMICVYNGQPFLLCEGRLAQEDFDMVLSQCKNFDCDAIPAINTFIPVYPCIHKKK